MKIRSIVVLATAAASLCAVPSAVAQSLTSLSIVGVSNTTSPGTGIHALAQDSHSDTSVSTATAAQSFTGLNGAGSSQTMTFQGTTITQATYGGLHSYTTGSLTNSYYNATNPSYVQPDGSINTAGSPDSLASLGFAIFDDTLQFGGSLQSGYRARYIFHVEGTNSGIGYLADMAFQIDSNPAESFFSYSPGYSSEIWATQSYLVNGITPQNVHVQFSNQVVFDTFTLDDGQDYTGTCDFSNSLTLVGIEMLDANGDTVDPSTWTVTSGSGTVYTPVPEPATLALAGLLLLRRKRKQTGAG